MRSLMSSLWNLSAIQNKIKIWLFSLFFVSIFSFPVFAADRNDCFIVNTSSAASSKLLETLQNDPLIKAWVLPLPALQKALDHLQAQCCALNIISQASQTCKDTRHNRKNATFPQSSSIFDQLLDVQFRRLKNDLSNYQGLPSDQNAKKRSDSLKTTFLTTDGKLPWEIIKDYNENWDFKENQLLPNYHDNDTSAFLSEVRKSPALTNTNNWNLRSKYLNACSISSYFSILLSTSNENLASELAKAAPLCKNLTNQLISEEISFIQNAITYKSNKLTTDTLQDYAVNYFGSRLMYLQIQLDKVNGQLLSATRQIPKLVRSCN